VCRTANSSRAPTAPGRSPSADDRSRSRRRAANAGAEMVRVRTHDARCSVGVRLDRRGEFSGRERATHVGRLAGFGGQQSVERRVARSSRLAATSLAAERESTSMNAADGRRPSASVADSTAPRPAAARNHTTTPLTMARQGKPARPLTPRSRPAVTSSCTKQAVTTAPLVSSTALDGLIAAAAAAHACRGRASSELRVSARTRAAVGSSACDECT